MKNLKYFYLLLLSVMFGFVATSCSENDDDKYAVAPAVEFVEPENGFSVEVNENLAPEIKVTGSDPLDFSWTVEGKEVANDRSYTFRQNKEGLYNLTVTAKNSKGYSTAETQVLVVKPGTDIAASIDRSVGTELPRNVITMIKANVYSLHNVDYLWTVACEDSTWTSTDKDLEFLTPFTGKHTVTLTVSNILGSATDEYEINVKHGPLTVAIEQDGELENKVETGKYIKLTATATGDSVAAYKWLVNGVEECDSAVFDFLKVTAGDYDVVLKAFNLDGEAFETKAVITVYNAGFNFGLRLANCETEIGEGEEMPLYVVCEWDDATYEWTVDGQVVATTKEYTFPGSTEIGKVFKVGVVVKRGSQSYPFEKTIKIGEKYAAGAYFLFEGNMTSENGALSFISNSGTVYNKLFRTNNDGAELGNVSQGLFLRNRKIYIVAQNGQNTAYGVPNGGGIVTIMDGRTMKKIDSFNKSLFGNLIVWPREIYVPDDRYAILKSTNQTSDNGSTTGVLDMVERKYYQMILPEGDDVYISAYVVRKGKAYAAIKNGIYLVDVANHKIGEKVLTLSFDIAKMAPSRDGSVWAVSSLSTTKKSIAKLTSDMKLVAENKINIEMSSGSGMSVLTWSAGSDYIFFATSTSGTGTKPIIKYHFDTNTITEFSPKSFYNAFGYNEERQSLYIGQMNEWDCSGAKLKKIETYKISGASWPAGIWFTYNFDEW